MSYSGSHDTSCFLLALVIWCAKAQIVKGTCFFVLDAFVCSKIELFQVVSPVEWCQIKMTTITDLSIQFYKNI